MDVADQQDAEVSGTGAGRFRSFLSESVPGLLAYHFSRPRRWSGLPNG
jgi:hypothetical protein